MRFCRTLNKEKKMNWLVGKKTYFVAAGVVVHALVQFVQGNLDLNGGILEILNGLGLATLRAGVSKTAPKP